MNSPNTVTKNLNPNPDLREQLERIGLTTVAAQLDDMLAHAAKQRWSPRQLLEQAARGVERSSASRTAPRIARAP